MKEGANQSRAALHVAHGAAEESLQRAQVGRTVAAQEMPLQVSVKPLYRIHLRGVGGQAMKGQTVPKTLEGPSGAARPVCAQSVPKQHEGFWTDPQEIAHEADDLSARHRPAHLVQPEVGIGGGGRNRRELGPTHAVPQDRRLSSERPGLRQTRQQGESALVEKDHPSALRPGFFFKRGQV